MELLEDLFRTVRDGASVRRVFAEPYEKDGVTVIPAAVVTSVGGGGRGTDGHDEGGGGGLALSARPVGAYVVRDGTVRWRPAIDVDHLLLAAAVVVLAWATRRAPHRRRGA